jgi:hypothetical protein
MGPISLSALSGPTNKQYHAAQRLLYENGLDPGLADYMLLKNVEWGCATNNMRRAISEAWREHHMVWCISPCQIDLCFQRALAGHIPGDPK